MEKTFLVKYTIYDGCSWSHRDYEKVIKANSEEEARAKAEDFCSFPDDITINSITEIEGGNK